MGDGGPGRRSTRCSPVRLWGGFPLAASIKTIGGRNHYFRFIANQNSGPGMSVLTVGLNHLNAITTGCPEATWAKAGCCLTPGLCTCCEVDRCRIGLMMSDTVNTSQIPPGFHRFRDFWLNAGERD
jgi:hypothetical protein